VESVFIALDIAVVISRYFHPLFVMFPIPNEVFFPYFLLFSPVGESTYGN